MTIEEFRRIGKILHEEMEKVDADVMDYYRISKLVSGIAMLKLLDLGADDAAVMEGIDTFTESLRTDLRSAWPEMKKKCIVIPN